MTITRHSLVKSTSILMISQVLSWGLSLFLTLYLPRYLGVENIGKYQLALSLWAIISIFAAFGTDTYLTREIAKDHSRVNIYVSQAIIIILSLFIVGTVFLGIYLYFAHYTYETVVVIGIIGVSSLISLISASFAAAIQGLERVAYLGITAVLTNIISTSACFVAMFLGAGLNTIAWISSLGAIFSFAILLFFLLRITPFQFIFDLHNIKPFLTISFSFFLLQVFITLYNQVDIVVISWFLDEKAIGWYGVAARLTGSLMFIPTVFMKVFYPVFSRMSTESPANLVKIFRKAFNIMLLLGVAAGLGVFAIAGPLVRLIYGAEFANSAPILSLRGIVAIATFENIILGIYLVALNRQKGWVVVMAVATIATIPLDIYFIPLCQRLYNNGALGGAYSYLTTEFGMTIAGILLLPKKTLELDTIWYAGRTMLAGMIMALGTWWFRNSFILVPILVGGSIFLALVILFKLITREEWTLISAAISPIIKRLFKRRTAEIVLK